MSPFNLTTDRWIPVRLCNGDPDLVSLVDLFRDAREITDLDLRPHERISVMRLLVCIAQAENVGGIPEEGFEEFGKTFAEAAASYLERNDISPYFELFGDGPRFLQLPVQAKEPTPASKLFPRLATGNNATFLDHDGGSERRFEPHLLALALLTFQNFYPLYGAGYKGRGPCVDSNTLHTLIRGDTLHETIVFNCVDAPELEGFSGGAGCPIWEQFPSDLKDSAAIGNATCTYLGRLVPLHRSICLTDDRTAFLLAKESIIYPPFDQYSREPSATVVVWGKGDKAAPRLLPARLDRSVWRQLHAITARRNEDKSGAPATVNTFRQNHPGKSCRIWTGALVADNAKILDVVESTFELPDTIFCDSGRATYGRGVQHAELWESRLKKAVIAFGRSMMEDKPSTTAATNHFWNTVDQQSGTLLKVIQNPEWPDGVKPDGSGGQYGYGSKDPWSPLVIRAARAAFEVSCPRRTPRHLEAYAIGLGQLFPKPKAAK